MEIPCRRHTSSVLAPASCSHNSPMICSSLKRLAFIAVSFFRRRTLPQIGAAFGVQATSSAGYLCFAISRIHCPTCVNCEARSESSRADRDPLLWRLLCQRLLAHVPPEVHRDRFIGFRRRMPVKLNEWMPFSSLLRDHGR